VDGWEVAEANSAKVTYRTRAEVLRLQRREIDTPLQRYVTVTLTTEEGSGWDEYFRRLQSRLDLNVDMGIWKRSPEHDVGRFVAFDASDWIELIESDGRAFFECAPPAIEAQAPNTRCRGFIFASGRSPSAYVEFSSAAREQLATTTGAVENLIAEFEGRCEPASRTQ
jgi:hypothetical protein